MKNLLSCVNKHSKTLPILSILFFLSLLTACSDKQSSNESVEQNTSESIQDSKWVANAKVLTKKHKLTSLLIECLSFEEEDVVNGKKRIDVREVHNEKCGGDPNVAPRVFSFQVDMATGEFKTDRYSLSAEFESFSNLSIEDGL